jgi:hypothetical protein
MLGSENVRLNKADRLGVCAGKKRLISTGLRIDAGGWARQLGRCSDAALREMPHNIRMHLTGYSGLRPLPPTSDAGR